MFKRLRNYFFTGLLVILPVVLTIGILKFLVTRLNVFLLEPITRFFPALQSNVYFEYVAKALVFILAIFSIILVGLATKVIVIRNVFRLFEKMFKKVPMVNKIYTAIKQLSHAFLGNHTKIFEKVALVEYPRKGIYSIGFVTTQANRKISKKIDEQELFNVFIPTSPNPTSGVFLLVPKAELKFVEMRTEEALKLVISAGKVAPPISNSDAF